MTTNEHAARSRRAVLAAAVGAAAATVASAIGRPAEVRAGTDGDVVLGALNESGNVTTIRNTNTAGAAIAGTTTFGTAVSGEAGIGAGVSGTCTEGVGVYGFGGGSFHGVQGGGVHGATAGAYGVLGEADAGVGVLGRSGFPVIPFPAKTGVHGFAAQDADARGVHGLTTVGQGVRGEATSGVGVYATAATGTALQVLGKTRFSRSGKAIVVAGSSRVDVNLGANGGLAGTPLCFANLLRYRPGVHVAAVRPNYPSTGKLRIYLNKAVTTSTAVAWVVLS